MKKVTTLLLFLLIFVAHALPSFAGTIDLSSWSAYTYNLEGSTNNSNWQLSADNQSVTQTFNSNPSVYLNNISQQDYQMEGSWEVNTTLDDDFIGFVFGFQDASHFYLMDWKQGSQAAFGATASTGFTIKKISAGSESELTFVDFWSSQGTENSTILASSLGTGWRDYTSYDFKLDFGAGNFSVEVLSGTTSLWSTTVTDSAYTYGDFGFYNFSQNAVQYSGFEQTGGVIAGAPVPEPSTLFLLGSGLCGLVWVSKKRKKE